MLRRTPTLARSEKRTYPLPQVHEADVEVILGARFTVVPGRHGGREASSGVGGGGSGELGGAREESESERSESMGVSERVMARSTYDRATLVPTAPVG